MRPAFRRPGVGPFDIIVGPSDFSVGPGVSTGSRGVIVVFARAPRSGKVKTRLCPPLTDEQAAGLYAQMLTDVLEATAGFAARFAIAPVVALHPPEACGVLARELPVPTAFRVVPQRGDTLAQRMAWAVREAAATGASRILLRGSDSPTLDGDTVGAAFAALEEVDLALSPDRDGGYNLVALRHPAPGLFDHPMSTASVLDDTLANAERLGLRARILPPGFDVDRVGDLAVLAGAREGAGGRLCPRTLEYLDREDLWRFANLR